MDGKPLWNILPARIRRNDRTSTSFRGDALPGGLHALGRCLCGLLAAAVFVLAVGCTPPGNTYTVNHAGDEGDDNPGDGYCRITAGNSPNAFCTLRAAIEEANARTGTQTIAFNLSASNTVLYARSQLSVSEDLIIDGTTQPGYDGVTPAVHLSGDPNAVVPTSGLLAGSATVTIRAMHIEQFKENGLRIFQELILDGSIVSDNQWTGIAFLGGGSGAITASTIRENGTQDPVVQAGGVYMENGDVTISDSLISENTSWFGGGIFQASGTLRLDHTTLTNNIGWDAGGIYFAGGTGAELWIDDSIIGQPGAGNTAGIISDGDKFGGGIYSQGNVHLSNSRVEGNSGAGIQSRGFNGTATLDINGSVVQGNSLTGIHAYYTDTDIVNGEIRDNGNGGIFLAQGSLTVLGGSISDNHVNGGIIAEACNLEVKMAAVSGNVSVHSGGGIYGNALHDAAIFRSTISGNTAADRGGGLYLTAATGKVEILNSTISGNEAGISAGGMGLLLNAATVNFVTVAGNTSPKAGGILGDSAVSVSNSILAGNSGENCDLGTFVLTSGGHNIVDDDTCNFSLPGDQTGADPELGPLADNGGGTLTHALQASSPAIDATDDLTCPKTDQRGVLRPFGAHCDIGAYESESPRAAPLFTYTPTRSQLRPSSTPTNAPAGYAFDPMEYSANPVFPPGPSCTPNEVTIRVKLSSADRVKSVGLFYRLETKAGGALAGWSEGLAMTPEGGGWYRLTLPAEDIPGIRDLREEGLLAIQFVANGAGGEVLARSGVYRDLVVKPCTRSG
jgi:CSLREA domain-containing protein